MARPAPLCELSESISVLCSVSQSWQLFTNNELTSSWAPQISHVSCPHPTLNTGVKRKTSVVIDGEPGYTIEECTHYEPEKRIDYQIIEETFGFSHMLNSYGFSVLFNDISDGTRLTMHTRFEAKRIFQKIMTSEVTEKKLREMMINLLAGFKQFAENGH